MPDPTEHAPQVVHLSLLVGEAYGRLPVPLAGLPANGGIGAFSVPRKRPDGTVVVPVDRKERFRPREADLIGTQPVEAFAPPADVTTAELRWILETGSVNRPGESGDSTLMETTLLHFRHDDNRKAPPISRAAYLRSTRRAVCC
jgi:hypothetical protein